MADVITKESKIHGKGVFASRGFKKGEVVLKWDISHELTKEEADSMPKGEKRYVSFFDGKYVSMQSPERYVNHSCGANTQADNFCDIAKRDIEEGEEVTADYAEEGVPDLDMACECGSKDCRGIIRTGEK